MITYNKLVRDKTLEKIGSTKGTAVYHTATDKEFGLKLKEKLAEETNELIEAKTIEDIQNELADVLKVTEEIMKFHNISEKEITQELANVLKFTDEIMKKHNISKEEIIEIMKKKDEEAGGFDKRIILEEASEY